jgi:hypothetical protein
MFFSADRRDMRPVKAINTFTQLSFAIALTVGNMLTKGADFRVSAIFISFFFCRLLQPVMNLMQKCGAKSGKVA